MMKNCICRRNKPPGSWITGRNMSPGSWITEPRNESTLVAYNYHNLREGRTSPTIPPRTEPSGPNPLQNELSSDRMTRDIFASGYPVNRSYPLNRLHGLTHAIREHVPPTCPPTRVCLFSDPPARLSVGKIVYVRI